MSQFSIGHYLTLTPPTPPVYRFQNFFINEDKQYGGETFQFVPFGFSGINVNRSGENSDQTLIFPNVDLIRVFADAAIVQCWVAEVEVLNLRDIAAADGNPESLGTFIGQVASGGWEPDTIAMTLNSVLDAVVAQIPSRSLRQDFVGNLPISGSLSS